MINTRYGKWTVIAVGSIEGNKTYYKVLCDCGKTSEVELNNLRYGRSTQCRACAGAKRLSKDSIMLKPGERYGRWVDVEEVELSDDKRRSYTCECACGNKATVPGYNLRSGRSTQCNDCKLQKF